MVLEIAQARVAQKLDPASARQLAARAGSRHPLRAVEPGTVNDALLRSALDALEAHDARAEDVVLVRGVPGVELPGGCGGANGDRAPDALVGLGDRPPETAITRSRPRRGDPRARHLSAQAEFRGFGLLTGDTMDQATSPGLERATRPRRPREWPNVGRAGKVTWATGEKLECALSALRARRKPNRPDESSAAQELPDGSEGTPSFTDRLVAGTLGHGRRSTP